MWFNVHFLSHETQKISTLPSPGFEPTTKKSTYTPQTTKPKKNEENFFSTLPTPGLEPGTKQFKADAKMT